MFALKLARAAGLKVILSSSSDEKLRSTSEKFPAPPLLTVNYGKNPNWHEEVLKLTDGAGVDLVIEVGGTQSLVKSMKCTRRGGTISQVGYLSKQDVNQLAELLPLIIDRRVNLRSGSVICLSFSSANSDARGINAGSKQDMDDLCAAISATQMRFDDIIDSISSFEKADEAIEYIWQGKQIGKLVIRL